jgi:hypothetical protein
MPQLQFQVPEDVSFPQAIGLAQAILNLSPPLEDAVLEQAVGALVKSENGARGWFVTFLSGDSDWADQPADGVVRAMRSSPQLVADLMAKNLVMSTAMILTHRANGDEAQAAGSAQVQARSLKLIELLQLPELQAKLARMLAAAQGQGDDYQAFLERWGYDARQLAAIVQVVQQALGK